MDAPDCLYQLRARDADGAWQHVGHPYCDESAAIGDAERFCERFVVVEVIDMTTNRVVHRAHCRPVV